MRSISHLTTLTLACAAVLTAGLSSVQAVTYTWDNAVGTAPGSPGDWNADASWITPASGVPGAGDTAYFVSPGALDIYASVSSVASVGNILVENRINPNISGATLTMNNSGSASTISHVFRGSLTVTNNIVLANNLNLTRTNGENDARTLTLSGSITGTGNISATVNGRGYLSLNNINSTGSLFFAMTQTGAGVSSVNGIIGSNVTSLSMSGTGGLHLSGSSANLYTGGTLVSGGTLFADKAGALGAGDVSITGGVLQLNAAAMSEAIGLYLTSGGMMALNASQNIGELYFDGILQSGGTWGATGSGADNINDTFFSGTGVLTVTSVPEPGAAAMLVMGLLSVCALRRRQVL